MFYKDKLYICININKRMGNHNVISYPENMVIRYCISVPFNNGIVPATISKKQVTTTLIRRSSEELKSSRCAAYQYLIP